MNKNRFHKAQRELISARIRHIEDEVLREMMIICKTTRFSSKTSFQFMCATVFNRNLSPNMKKITQRTIATNIQYWSILKPIYDSNRNLK